VRRIIIKCLLTVIFIMSWDLAVSQDVSSLKERFLQTAKITSISGHETDLSDYISRQLPESMTIETDNMGNLIAHTGTGNPEILVIAHLDEPGYVITEIRKDGYMRVQPLTRTQTQLFHQFHEGHLVEIHTKRGIINGVVSIPSSHITRNKPSVMPLDQFIIDTGCESDWEVKSLGIQMLDPVSAVRDIAHLQGSKLSGPSLSRKYSAQALLEIAKSVVNITDKPIAFAWTTQNLRRNPGVMCVAKQIKAEAVICITTFKREINNRTGAVSEPVSITGSGVLIDENLITENIHSNILSQLLKTAVSQKVKINLSSTGRLTATRYFADIPFIPLAIPVMYPESLVEVIDLDDLDQLIKVVSAVLKSY